MPASPDIPLLIIPFSGPHGVGKSTLMRVLYDRLSDREWVTEMVPSVTATVFASLQQQAKDSGGEVPEGFDDIDRLQLRHRYQFQVLTTMHRALEAAVSSVVGATSPFPRVVLMDRWFTDVVTYTAQQLRNPWDETFIDSFKREAQTTLCHIASFNGYLAQPPRPFMVAHIRIPASASPFAPDGDRGKMTATGSREEWDNLYHIHCAKLDLFGTHTIHQPDLTDRVDSILELIDQFIHPTEITE